MSEGPVTIYHNPACGTSRKTLAALEEGGHQPKVVEYLEEGWTRPQLEALLERMGASPRDVLREKGSPAEELGLLEEGISDDVLLDAMVKHPVLVNRPIVVTAKGAALVRPVEKLQELL